MSNINLLAKDIKSFAKGVESTRGGPLFIYLLFKVTKFSGCDRFGDTAIMYKI